MRTTMTASTCASFGEHLRRCREVAGLTQEQLAEQAGMTAKGISALERGERLRPYPATVRRLAAALALPPEQRAAFEALARGRGASRAQRGDVPLVGRARELAAIERRLTDDGPPALLLAGEPGIGKTRLLREASRRAGERGWRVLAGGCRRHDGQGPYAPIADALSTSLRAQTPDALRRSLQGCSWLTLMLPELTDLLPESPPRWIPPADQQRRLLFGAVARFLRAVAGPRGSLLVLDDLQWADADALDLLLSLLRGTAPSTSAEDAATLRVIAAYRNTELRAADPLSATLADLAHAGLAAHETLVPLNPRDARQLLDALLDDPGDDAGSAPSVVDNRRTRAVERAEGVPFFLVSYAQALRDQPSESAVDAQVPWDVAQSIRQRAGALPEPARDVLGIAALAGRAVDPSLVVAVAAQEEQDVLRALDAAGLAGLLVEEDSSYLFAHEVTREVIEAALGAARRQYLHRRLGEVLERREPPTSRALLAHHYSRGNVPEKAIEHLEAAGDAAVAQAAWATAAAHYADLAHRLDALGRALPAAHARHKLGISLQRCARLADALQAMEQAAAAYCAAGDLEQHAAITGWIANWYVERGQPDVGMVRVQALLYPLDAAAGAAPAPLLRAQAALVGTLAHLHFHGGSLRDALDATERGSALARATGSDHLLAIAELRRGNALRMVGRVEEALPVMEDAVRLADASGAPFLPDALDNLIWVYIARGELAVARRHNDRAFTCAEQLRDPIRLAVATCTRGVLAFLRGAWQQSRADLERSLSLYRQFESARASAYPLAELGRVILAMGDMAQAVRLLHEALAIAERSGDVHALRLAQSALAEHDLRDGAPEAALARLVPLLDRPGMEEWQVTELLPLVAWAHLDAGRVAEAEHLAARCIARARAQTNRLALIHALRIGAYVALYRQPREAAMPLLDDALPLLDEALSLARHAGYPLGEARTLEARGELWRARGAPAQAEADLAAAVAIYDRLGARLDLARARDPGARQD
jgi:transcriptional regulator with XRE-family HTH domain/tetratricopeptide (TPR) repeat protein